METSKTSSTVVIVDAGEHLFKVVGHSKVIGTDACLTSETFRVGGYDWAVLYYPNGDALVADGQFTSLFLKLVSTIESDVTASFSFCLQDPASPATGEKNKRSLTKKFLPSGAGNDEDWGHRMFLNKDDLAASGCLVDDCLVIKCAVEVTKLVEVAHEHDSIVIAPPSDLSTDLRHLLERGHKADLTIKIGNSKSFDVNTCVLRARSPVFRDQLCDSMIGSAPSSICIEDMDAKVFEALLHYMYSDCLPRFMEENTEGATSMAKDLLVAAHRYRIERLKVMCESRLSKSLNVNIVCSSLDLAEEYNCEQLKGCCLKYMTTDRERLRTIKGTKGFEQLMKNRPLIISDILDKVIQKLNLQDATTPAPAPAP